MRTTINCKGKLMSFDEPKVMGILNITPDSFFDGGKYKSDADFLNQTEKMLTEGAAIIDVGAYSSRPDAVFVSEQEEIERLIPIVSAITQRFPEAVLSIDTFRAQVAQAAIDAGAAIINDIAAGLLDDNMLAVVGKNKVPYIMMHMRGNPQTMKDLHQYEDITKEMIQYFSERIAAAHAHQITDIIIDPGFGFSKTTDQNYEVLNNLDVFHILEYPILSALSRKSMIYKFLGTKPAEALNGTTVLHTISLLKGAKLLRAHDVKEAVECIKLVNQTIKHETIL
ncbi:dihydropteroate synthase [Flavobacterium agricola]|uniref:Dihydropteroate synthase n=1 Tax=Flavobacterium agricola TaxID=2870839 RepID=A0ABY6M4Q0_9FLAO|nr:dihydropteroate synthase [Flavobacterium agricola]UYW02183.1 dihydropteroate synthase [Flavobacterium agricola]